ncbi:MAG: RNA-binding protein [Spirochaetales bacterium]|jgi:RNA recognition motif-containing protein|nr:RNA-binding protein [Spirochaetales bacterium]
MAKNIYVGNISFKTTEDGLKDFFTQYGEVVRVKIVKDRETNRSQGYGFVEMSDDDAATAAITALNGKELDGRALRINEALPRTEKPHFQRN